MSSVLQPFCSYSPRLLKAALLKVTLPVNVFSSFFLGGGLLSPLAKQKANHSRWVDNVRPSEEVVHKPWEAAVDTAAVDVENAAAKDTPSREAEGKGDIASDAASGDVDAPPPVLPRDTPKSPGGGEALEDPGEYFAPVLHRPQNQKKSLKIFP